MTETTWHRILFWGALLGVLTFIFGSSLQPATVSGGESQGFYQMLLDWFGPLLSWMTHGLFRKLAHFTEYAICGAILSFAPRLYRMPRAWHFLLPILGGAVALMDEFLLQSFSLGRAPSWADCGIDLLGCLFGYAAFYFLLFLFSKKQSASSLKRI